MIGLAVVCTLLIQIDKIMFACLFTDGKPGTAESVQQSNVEESGHKPSQEVSPSDEVMWKCVCVCV